MSFYRNDVRIRIFFCTAMKLVACHWAIVNSVADRALWYARAILAGEVHWRARGETYDGPLVKQTLGYAHTTSRHSDNRLVNHFNFYTNFSNYFDTSFETIGSFIQASLKMLSKVIYSHFLPTTIVLIETTNQYSVQAINTDYTFKAGRFI